MFVCEQAFITKASPGDGALHTLAPPLTNMSKQLEKDAHPYPGHRMLIHMNR